LHMQWPPTSQSHGSVHIYIFEWQCTYTSLNGRSSGSSTSCSASAPSASASSPCSAPSCPRASRHRFHESSFRPKSFLSSDFDQMSSINWRQICVRQIRIKFLDLCNNATWVKR
jgi:hypothetical protein